MPTVIDLILGVGRRHGVGPELLLLVLLEDHVHVLGLLHWDVERRSPSFLPDCLPPLFVECSLLSFLLQ